MDLYGEGIPGILYSDGISTLYWEAEENEEEMRYSSPKRLSSLPIEGISQKINPLLLDLTGNGQLDLLVSTPVSGYYEANSDRTWRNFQTFPSFPNDFHNPDHYLVDVTGDGLADLLLIESDRVWVYPSRGKEGFANPVIRQIEGDISLPKRDSATEVGLSRCLGVNCIVSDKY